MLIKDIKAAIRDRLRDRITSASIMDYPDQPDTYAMRHATAELLVHYLESEGGRNRRVSMGVVVVTHTQPVNDRYLAAVLAVLNGYRIGGAHALEYIEDTNLGYEANTWKTMVKFTVAAPVPPVPDGVLTEYLHKLGIT
ncbi:MAG: Gp37 family protein [Geobacteraceae bacterium]|jgi:hypothetical protein|nr:Gp37 family protein [Geobacteraceae bacterium]